MADVKPSIPHLDRTANDPRQKKHHSANISRIELVNSKIRLIRLSLHKDGPPLRHLPGQYIDLHIPNVSVVGGFTIVSPPQTAIIQPVPATTSTAQTSSDDTSEFPCIDIAVQKAPRNPPAAYLWREPPSTILNDPVSIKIGGKFTYPPPNLSMSEFQNIANVVFIAGGVGINPIMSMVGAMDLVGPGQLGGMTRRVRILYASRRTAAKSEDENTRSTHGEEPKIDKEEKILFDEALSRIAGKYHDHSQVNFEYTLYETSSAVPSPSQVRSSPHNGRQVRHRRINEADLYEAVGGGKNDDENASITMRKRTLVYICGVPSMTDEMVAFLHSIKGFDGDDGERRVLYEKWW